MKDAKHWIVVLVYAMAMAWVESSVVFYLRTMIDRIQPYQPNPLPVIGALGPAELVREAATLLMLLTVGWLAGRNWRTRLAYSAIAFGAWDIFYYVFLRVLCGWPQSLGDWDILFLIPLPWWGPVWAPVSIAALMIAWGTMVTQLTPNLSDGRFPWRSWLLNAGGVALALYVFMADAIHVADRGVEALRTLLPQQFKWQLFCLALVLMAAPIVGLGRRLRLEKCSGSVRLGVDSAEVTCKRELPT